MLKHRDFAAAEALRNARAAPWLSGTVVAVCLLAGFCVALATGIETQRVADTAEAQYFAGSSVIEVTGQEGAPLDAVRCHSLMGIEGIIAAGGVTHWESVRLGTEPDADIRFLTVTPGFPVAAWPELERAASPSVVAASDLSRSGLRAGGTIVINSPTRSATLLRLDAVPERVSALGVDRVLLVTESPEGVVASCLVLAAPSAALSVTALVGDYFDEKASAVPRLLPSDLVSDPDELLNSRISQYGWLVAAALCGIALVGGWIARRAEFALYRLLGSRESTIVTMLVTEFVVLCLMPSQLGLILGIGALPIAPFVGWNLVVDIARFDLLLLALPCLAAFLLPRASLLTVLRGK